MFTTVEHLGPSVRLIAYCSPNSSGKVDRQGRLAQQAFSHPLVEDEAVERGGSGLGNAAGDLELVDGQRIQREGVAVGCVALRRAGAAIVSVAAGGAGVEEVVGPR